MDINISLSTILNVLNLPRRSGSISKRHFGTAVEHPSNVMYCCQQPPTCQCLRANFGKRNVYSPTVVFSQLRFVRCEPTGKLSRIFMNKPFKVGATLSWSNVSISLPNHRPRNELGLAA